MTIMELKFYSLPDKWGDIWNITFVQEQYDMDSTLYIGMYNKDEENGFLEDYGDLTVNLGTTLDAECACIDTNNMGEQIVDWLIDNDIATPTGEEIPSGFCVYPVVKFSQWFLDETPLLDEI